MLVRSGELKPDDLVWTEGMDDWKPAKTLEGLFGPPPVPVNPYASPASMVAPEQPASAGAQLEILDPPARLSVGGPMDLAMRMLKKDFGMILAAGVVYMGVLWGAGMVLGIVAAVFQANHGIVAPQPGAFDETAKMMARQILDSYTGWQAAIKIVQQLVTVFMGLGLARVALDVIEGKPVQIGQLFSQASKWAGAVAGTFGLLLLSYIPVAATMLPILRDLAEGAEPTAGQGLAAAVGLLVSLAAGAYLHARFGFFQAAMVDRDMGVVEAFKESSRLTRGNRWTVIGLGIVIGLVNLGGMLALCIGLILTIPLTTLAWYAAYKWMLHGPDALERLHPPQQPATPNQPRL
jgi:hypothetical protein